MHSIVTLTVNPAIDKNTTVDKVVPERKLRCAEPRFEPGGGGINVSRAIQRLGGESLAVYMVGGTTGHLLHHLMEEEGLNHYPVRTQGMTRENLIVYEEASGQQFRFGMPGPVVEEQDWQRCLQVIQDVKPAPGYMVVSGSLSGGIPDTFCALAAKAGKSIGSKVIVDVSGPGLYESLKEGVYMVKPNLGEFTELIGRQVNDELELETEARKIVESGQCRVIVISIGAGGVLAVWDKDYLRLQAPVVPIQSKVGAGDSMVAGIVLSLSRGWQIPEAIRYGVASGTAAVMTPGTELCRLEDAERIYAQMTSRL